MYVPPSTLHVLVLGEQQDRRKQKSNLQLVSALAAGNLSPPSLHPFYFYFLYFSCNHPLIRAPSADRKQMDHQPAAGRRR